jgi:lysophospholipase L1-like esterase
MKSMKAGTKIVGAMVLLLAAGLLFAILAADASNMPSGAHNRGVIMFLGDSNISRGGKWPVWDLTHGKGGLLDADHLDNNYVPVFVARAGAGIRTLDCLTTRRRCKTYDYWKIKLRETFRNVQPNAIVIELGINDTMGFGSASSPGYSEYAKKIDWLMELLPRKLPVLWTNLACDIEPTVRNGACDRVNDALALAPKRWPNLLVLDWAAVAKNHPEYMDPNLPTAYRIHYSDPGYAAWSQLVVRALDAKFPAAQ